MPLVRGTKFFTLGVWTRQGKFSGFVWISYPLPVGDSHKDAFSVICLFQESILVKGRQAIHMQTARASSLFCVHVVRKICAFS